MKVLNRKGKCCPWPDSRNLPVARIRPEPELAFQRGAGFSDALEAANLDSWARVGKFKAGVRILVLSDSCHSGTVTRASNFVLRWAARPRHANERRARSAKGTRKTLQGHPGGAPGRPEAKVKGPEVCCSYRAVWTINSRQTRARRTACSPARSRRSGMGGKLQNGYRKFRDIMVSKVRQIKHLTISSSAGRTRISKHRGPSQSKRIATSSKLKRGLQDEHH